MLKGNNFKYRLKDASHAWPIFSILSKIHLHPLILFGIVSISTYLIFLILVLCFDSFSKVICSVVHVLQICCSLSIFAGFSLGRISAIKFENALVKSKKYFNINDVEFTKIYTYYQDKMSSKMSLFFTVPIGLITATIFWLIGNNLPNNFMPIGSYSVVYIYIAYFEVSIFMAYLCGSVGLWCLLIITIGFSKLNKYRFDIGILIQNPKSFQLPKTVFMSVVMEFIVYSTIIPIIIYIIFENSTTDIILYVGILGMGSLYLFLFILLAFTQYSFYRVIITAKNLRRSQITNIFIHNQNEIELASIELVDRKIGFTYLNDLIELNSYLLKVNEYFDKKITGWFVDISAIGKLIASSILPIGSFISLVIKLIKLF